MNPELLDRLPPQNLDAERGVLGSILLDPATCDDVAALLAPDDFYADAHRKLFAHLKAAREAGRIDALTLLERLRQAGDLEAIGGRAYLGEIAQATPVAAHAVYYAKIVKEKSRLRDMIHAGMEIIRHAYEQVDTSTEILAAAEARLQAIHTGDYHAGPVDLHAAALVAVERMAEAKRIYDTGGQPSVWTGLEAVDYKFGGWIPGELVVMAARAGIGKTTAAVQVAYHNATRGRGVYVASLEMDQAEVAGRVVCGLAGIDRTNARDGRLDDGDIRRARDAANGLEGLPLWIDARPGMSVADVLRGARRYVSAGLALVVVDYIQRVTPIDRRAPRTDQVGQITNDLKQTARELCVPVLAIAQLNREAEKVGAPLMSHLHESGKIEQDADIIIFLWRKDGEAGTKWVVAKNRGGGKTGPITLAWDQKRGQLMGVPPANYCEEFDNLAPARSEAW